MGRALTLVIWLSGRLVLAARRSGHVRMLLGSLGALGVLALHMSGAGLVGGRLVNTSGIFFRAWTLLALGVTGASSAIVPALRLWSLQRRQARRTVWTLRRCAPAHKSVCTHA